MIDHSAHKQRLAVSLNRFRRWFCDAALPLWIKRGYDHRGGGFYEALNFDATPSLGRVRRTRAQARQIHVFSQAAMQGWNSSAEDLAARGFDFYLEHACPDGGARGCAHLLDHKGHVLDDRRDLYDQAFLLLACASRWQAAKDARALDLANITIAFLTRELASPHGGWFESDRKELPRRQNPHMHLFEAFMALFQATQDAAYLDFAEHIMIACFAKFYDGENGVLHERFDAVLHHDDKDRLIEPGHMFEWVWLLHRYEELASANYSSARAALYKRGADFGEDGAFHGFVNNTAIAGEPAKAGDKRLWPQTEYLRASLVQASYGDNAAAARAGALIDSLFDTYLNVDPAGLWIDEFDARGEPAAKDVPGSILYHLFEAVAEADNYLKTESAG